ncbi:MAG TPA: hypothetical protein VHZ99_01530 [Steroidobacteraceae bacterium]|jgi:hypothetical protein|nr:hypothetical protein [Steroidobacteraceae bacterium]
MKSWTALLLIAAPLLTAAVGAQEIEPGVQTSSSAAPVQPAAKPAPAAAPAVAAKPAAPARKTGAGAARLAASGATASPTAATAGQGKPVNGKSSDRIQLDTTQISGNQELPKVMYVVPWRRADPGEFSGRPPNSLLDEALTPVDRDVFKRQNRYYGALQADPTHKDEK